MPRDPPLHEEIAAGQAVMGPTPNAPFGIDASNAVCLASGRGLGASANPIRRIAGCIAFPRRLA